MEQHSSPTHGVEQIDPETAYRYLETTFKATQSNRKLSQAIVKSYAAEMRRGDWRLTSQGIGFDTAGVLRDGQHRLWAVIEANVTIPMLVSRGLPTESFDAVDIGRRRTSSDVLAIHGEVEARLLGAALAWQWRQDEGLLSVSTPVAARRISVADRLTTLAKHPGLRDAVAEYAGHRLGQRSGLTDGIAIWLWYQFSQRDAEAAACFFTDLRTGAWLAATDPVWLLREKLLSMRSAGTTREQFTTAAYVIKAWNLRRRGEAREQLTWRGRGPTAEPFPEIAG